MEMASNLEPARSQEADFYQNDRLWRSQQSSILLLLISLFYFFYLFIHSFPYEYLKKSAGSIVEIVTGSPANIWAKYKCTVANNKVIYMNILN